MFAICIESSHQKGMGHFYRMINFIECLKENNEKFIVLINDDKTSLSLLCDKNLPFHTVNFSNDTTKWETEIIQKYGVDIWLNDRMETSIDHAINIQENNILLITFDDLGGGAELSNLHFAAMPCIFNNDPKGGKIYSGIEYLILNSEINKCKRQRNIYNKLLVTLGGSDTYGVTGEVIKTLKGLMIPTDVIIGPSFINATELNSLLCDTIKVKTHVPSLIKEFINYDIAITGGGITPFEANASGLPCIIIANEPHEVENAEFLSKLGSSVFAGFHDNINTNLFCMTQEISKMSEIGLSSFNTNASERIYSIIKDALYAR